MAVAGCASMSVEQAAEYTGFGITYMGALVRAEAVPHLHVGARGTKVIIPRSPLDEWIAKTAWANCTGSDNLAKGTPG